MFGVWKPSVKDGLRCATDGDGCSRRKKISTIAADVGPGLIGL